MPDTNWKEVSDFFNGVIEEAADPSQGIEDSKLKIAVYSQAFGQTLTVTIPGRKVDDFMKQLSLFDAEVHRGSFVIEDWRNKY